MSERRDAGDRPGVDARPGDDGEDRRSLYDRFIPETSYVVDDLVLGGDSSQQTYGNEHFDAYAIASARRGELESLQVELGKVLSRHAGVLDASGIELHAKQIWNGSERARSVFARLESKAQMKNLLFDAVNAIASSGAKLTVAVRPFPGARSDTDATRMTKWTHIYAALSRFDRNLIATTGKHIGRPDFFLDPETVAIMRRRRRHDEMGGLIEAGSVDIGRRDTPHFVFYRRIDPIYVPTPSHAHRLIQVADLGAYLVNKWLTLHARLLRELRTEQHQAETVLTWMSDCNFCFQCCDRLDAEVVVPLGADEIEDTPQWLKPPLARYEPAFAAGVDLCVCSLREAAYADPAGRARLNGIGWWGIAQRRICLILPEQDGSFGY